MMLRYSGLTYGSLVNGPGVRNVLHLQGCTIGCKGCFNTHTWSHSGGKTDSIYKLSHALMKNSPDGVSISGGEPTEQWDQLRGMLMECHKREPGLDVLMFTGLTRNQLTSSGILEEAFKQYYLSSALISTIVCGPYDRERPSEKYLLGSENQEILTWDNKDIVEKGPRVEVQISRDGKTVVTGFPGKEAINEFKKNFEK